MKMLARFAAALLLALFAVTSVEAQWQVPAHSSPIGRGTGVQGFHSAAPGSAGNVLTSNGSTADPTFQPPVGGTLSTGTAISGASGSNDLLTTGIVSGGTGALTDSGFSALGIDTNTPNVRTASYTIAASDCGKTIEAGTGSTGQFTVTLPAITGFSATCSVLVKNGDTTNGKVLSGFPADLRTMLYPGQAVGVKIISGVWRSFYNPGRWVAQSNVTFYVNPSTGNDANDGLTTGTAFRTRQQGWNVTAADLDCHGNGLLIQLMDGTYTDTMQFGPYGPPGCSAVSVHGNNATPSNVLIAPATAGTNGFQNFGGQIVSIGGFKCNSSNINDCIYGDNTSVTFMDEPVVFGTVGTYHVDMNHSDFVIETSYSVTGNAYGHLSAEGGGYIECATSGASATVTNGISINYFAGTRSGGTIVCSSGAMSFGSPTVTGTRYVSQVNGIIDTGGSGASYFPGNTAGFTQTGGVYN